MRKTILLFIFCAAAFSAGAQNDKALYTFDRMEWVNPWLGTANAAGLSGNSVFLNDTLRSFNDAYLKGTIAAGGMKNIYDPETGLCANLGIDSYMKLGRTFLHGRVDFKYDYGTAYRWRGMVNPYEMPFMMADSIPGSISNEIYSLEAGIGIPLKNGWSVGVDAAYDASILAKHKDLRNKNTYMEFDITPGVAYSGRNFQFGLNLGYLRNTENIEYKQVDGSTEKYLFDLYGMWLYKSTGFTSAEQKRYKLRNEYYGGFQIGASAGIVRIFNDFEVRYTDASQTENGYNNLRYGDVSKLTYSDDLSLFVGMRHRVRISASGYRMNGYRFLQREELDPYSKVRRWVTYGDPVFCYDRNVLDGEISYTFRRVRVVNVTSDGVSAFDIDWEITGGACARSMTQNYYENPVQFSQKYAWVEPFVRFSKYWKKGANLIDFTPEVRYASMVGDCVMNEVFTGGAVEGESPWQLTGPLAEEYGFFASNRFGASLSLRYARILKKSSTVYVKGSYQLIDVTDGAMKGECRHYGNITIGYTF